MNRYNLEQELKEAKPEIMPISPLVRSRLDETYASLSELPAPGSRRAVRPRLRKAISITAAAGILGIGIFASGFVSPVMADSLKKIPLVGSLFSSIEGDIGLRTAGDLGLATPVDSGVSLEDVKLEVTETVFDGSRAAFLVNITAPHLQNGQYDNGKKVVKLSNAIENVFFKIGGKSQGDPDSFLKGLYYASAGASHPNMLVFEEVFDTSGTASIPQSFNAEVFITLQGIDHEFKLEIPFKRTTDNIVNVKPNTALANKELTFSVAEIHTTPVTTRLSASLEMNGTRTLNEKQETRLHKIGVALFDDQGRQLTALNGEGTYEANRLVFDSLYASPPGQTKYLILKPFVIHDDFTENVRENQFIKELEMKIDLSSREKQK